nr:fructan:fructan 1-fructosyltransferase [Tanacetum cinerariifolium]
MSVFICFATITHQRKASILAGLPVPDYCCSEGILARRGPYTSFGDPNGVVSMCQAFVYFLADILGLLIRTLAGYPDLGYRCSQDCRYLGESLRSSEDFNEMKLEPVSIVLLDVEPTTQFNIVALFEVDQDALTITTEVNNGYSFTTSLRATQRGTLGPFGIVVLADGTLPELIAVYFYIAKITDGRVEEAVPISQNESYECSLRFMDKIRNESKRVSTRFVENYEGR